MRLKRKKRNSGKLGSTAGTRRTGGVRRRSKGRWNELFDNDNPIYVELGMGKDVSSADMSVRNPQYKLYRR